MALTCPSCSARLAKGAAYCARCGHSTGVPLELADIELDDEVQARPVTVEPARPPALRNLLIGLGAVVVLVMAAMTFGRSASKSEATAPTTTTATTVSPTSTTATIPPPSTSAWLQLVPKGALLSRPSATALYGVTPQGQVVRVDVDTGGVTIRTLLPGNSNDMIDIIPRGDKVVISSAATMIVVNADLTGSVEQVELDDGSHIYEGPGHDLWLVHDQGQGPDGSPMQRTFQRIHLDGSPAGPALPLPAAGSVVGDDGTGRLLVYSFVASVTAVLDPSTGQPTRLPVGSPVATSARQLVDIVCDEHLSCKWRVTDRASGSSKLLDQPVSPEVLSNGGGGSLSGDGRWLAYLLAPGDVVVIDLTSGQQRRFSEARLTAYWGMLPSWSADSRWLFWDGGDDTYVWAAGSAGAQKLGDGSLPAMTNLVAVPASTAS